MTILTIDVARALDPTGSDVPAGAYLEVAYARTTAPAGGTVTVTDTVHITLDDWPTSLPGTPV